MSSEENKAVVRKAIETVNKQDLSLVDDLVAPNYFDHTTQQGLEQHKEFLAMLFKGFPDLLMTIEDMIAEGDRVWVRTN
ncbi:MAG: ester cyclase [Candidatus Bathyarchaeota archaeon]|nr:ester cyclase [Candidatus Bathyarchaeota archaeon]